MTGRQTLILRKGGILEGPGGFAPEHPSFWLYPTHVHQAEQGLRLERGGEAPTGSTPVATDRVMIQAFAVVELIHFVAAEAMLPSLEAFHILTEETVRKRFHYRKPGLWVMGVRIFRREEPWPLDPTPEKLGCKTWVVLDTPIATQGLEPVIDAHHWTQRLDRLRSKLL
jgi:hypothetical protein